MNEMQNPALLGIVSLSLVISLEVSVIDNLRVVDWLYNCSILHAVKWTQDSLEFSVAAQGRN